jgi:mRNA interferase MazF
VKPKRAEVWWGEEPERNRRPYLVLTRNSAIGTLNEVLVAAVTRTIRSIPTQVEIDESDGMPVACVVNLDNLLMMPLTQLTERVCDLGPERMAEVCAALDAATEC